MLIILRSRQATVCPIWTIAKRRQIAKHVGESSANLCDRLSRTRDFSQRQLPTDHDYATSTREYQTDQSSLKPAPTAAGSVLDKREIQPQRQKQPHKFAGVDRSLHIRSHCSTSSDRQTRAPSPILSGAENRRFQSHVR